MNFEQLDARYRELLARRKAGVLDAQKFEGVVLATLNAAGLQPTIVRSGEVWAPFRGGASVARSSHWYVIVK